MNKFMTAKFIITVAIVSLISTPSVFTNAQMNSTYFVDKPTTCMASLREASEPRPLEFCYWLNDKSCCTPANDAAAKSKFQEFTDLGPGCAPTDHKIRAAYREVHQFACLPCHPREPDFRVDKRVGDKHLPGGQIAPDPAAKAGDFVWRVCLSFVLGKEPAKKPGGLWGKDGKKFDMCGIRPKGPSGVDFTIPSVAYASDNLTQTAIDFVAELPSFLEGFGAYIVDDINRIVDYNATPCFLSAGKVEGGFLLLLVMMIVTLLTMLW